MPREHVVVRPAAARAFEAVVVALKTCVRIALRPPCGLLTVVVACMLEPPAGRLVLVGGAVLAEVVECDAVVVGAELDGRHWGR